MARGEKLETWDLTNSTLTAPRERVVNARHVVVVSLPPGGAGLVELQLDGGAWIPVREGRRFSACAGADFNRLNVRAPALGGAAKILCSSDDLVAFAGEGDTASAGAAGPTLRAFYGPLQLGQDGTPVSNVNHFLTNAVRDTGGMWAVMGNAPTLQRGFGRSVIACNPGGATSGVYLSSFGLPWRRDRARCDSRALDTMRTVRVEMMLGRDAAGGTKGIDHGVYFFPSHGVAPGLPSGPNVFFGMVGDGAGGWRFYSRATGAGALLDHGPVTVTAVGNLSRVRFDLIAADPIAGRDGLVRLYVDDRLQVEVEDMLSIPAIGSASPSNTTYNVAISDTGADTERLNFCDVEVSTPLGVVA